MDSSSESHELFNLAYRELLQHLHALGSAERRGPEFKVYYDRFSSTKGLRIWKYLKLLLVCIDKCSNAHEVMQNWKSSLDKTDSAVKEIAVNLRYLFEHGVPCGNGTMSTSFIEAFDQLSASEENICTLFKLEIGDSLENLSRRPLELKWNRPLPAIRLCHGLFVCAQQSVECIIHQSLIYLPGLGIDRRIRARRFLAMVNPLLDFLWYIRQENVQSESVIPDDDIINFLNHLASVAVRTVNQGLSYWVNKKVDPQLKIVGLQQLQDEIDLVSPHFLQLMVKFLRALQKIRPGNFAPSFARYILHPTKYISPDAKIFIETLLAFFINESEEGPSHSLLSEIEVMLTLVVFYARNLSHLSYLELHTRICLLNEEVLLRQQLNCSSTISLGNQVEELNKLLKFLENFSDHPQTKKNGNVERTSMFVHELVSEVASLYQSFDEKKITKQMMQISLFKLLLKIVLFKADFSSMELSKFLDINEGMKSIGKGSSERFIEGLNFFRAFVTNLQDELTDKDAELIFARIEESARGITTLCYTLEIGNVKEEKIENVILSFSFLLDRMTVLKSECRYLCCTNPTSSSFPKVVGMGFIDFLLQNLQELLKLGHGPVALVKDHIERFGLELEVTRSFLMKLDTVDPEMVNLARCATEAAYEGEYIIDSIEVGNGDCWQALWLCDVIQKIRLINLQATNICWYRSSDAEGHNIGQTSSQRISRARMPEIGDLVVCISDDEEIVIDRLTRGSSQRHLISIVGMPGIGKTTLAKKMYNDPRVTFHFHVRAWCSVSQVFVKRELLLEILFDTASGFAEKRDILQMTDDDLASKLYQCLKGRRYLIVLDDVWDTEAWDSLERSFPNDENGSRVMMTSRLRDVALKAKPDSNPHELRLFNDDESWNLLQMKIFQGGCPEELLEVGKEIAKNCKGLPLAVVAIAGILERTERKKDSWRQIAESLTRQIIDDPQTRCMDILQMSYNQLPDHLKVCFLYLAAFFVDKDIPVCKLIRLWIAEGFIPKTEIKCLEDVAEDYLLDLIGRSLVTASRKGSDGRVKACRMHDLLHDLCLSKAKEENFLQLITGSDMPYASFSDLDFGDDYLDCYTFHPVKYEKYRVRLFLNRKQFVKSSPFGPGTRSLIFSATSDQYPRCPYDISFISTNFKLLRVLDLESINMGTSFPTGIESLVLLRYLAVSGDIDLIPPAISKLQKLETLIVNGLKGKVILPDTIWCMERLRHLHVNNHVVFNFDDDNLGSFLQLVNLVSFSSPSLAYGKEKILRRLPNLCKLKCIFLESWDASTNCNKFPVLDFLDRLESLKVLYIGRSLNPGELILPRNLKKLTLSNFRLPWTHTAAIGGLKNLEVLKLQSRAFEGKIWDMNEGEFLKLKYLKLDRLNIVQWNASSDHLPNLQQLLLRNCESLKEVPYAFWEIPTLLRIEVQSCGQSAEESVRNIGELGVEGLEIFINQKIHI